MEVLYSSPRLNLNVKGQVLSVELTDESTRNAVGFETARTLSDFFLPTGKKISFVEKMCRENQIGCIVVRSNVSDVFASGGHLNELAEATKPRAQAFANAMRGFCLELTKLPVPTVTFLNGAAYGGGSELALASDFRWATNSSASLHFWQTKWGVPGGWNGMLRLSEISSALSHRAVALLFASQASMQKQELLHYGLIDRDFSDDFSNAHRSATEAAEKLAARILQCPSDLRAALFGRAKAKITVASDKKLFEKFWKSAEHQKRLLAFDKRPRMP